MILKPRNISGFADYNEAENTALSVWIRSIESTYRLFGFSRLTPRPVELREVLLSKGGIQKQIFGISRLQNDLTTDMALPFDRTVPLAYWVAKHQIEITFPYKRYDISYSYRGERAQAGRFQGFFQADVDIIGQNVLDTSADSETINVIYNALQNLGFNDIYLCVNELNLINNVLQILNIPQENIRDVLNVIDSIQKISQVEFIAELQSIVPINEIESSEIRELFLFEGNVNDFKDILQLKGLTNAAIEQNFKITTETISFLINSGIPVSNIIFRPAIVRGLDYYTGIVFETFVKGQENLGSIASGGRYDNLASTFTNAILPGVGGSIGLTRLFDLAIKNNLIPLDRLTEADFFVGYRDPLYKSMGNLCAFELRKRGHFTDMYSGSGNFKKQLIYADKKGFKTGVFIMAEDSIIVKDLKTKNQVDLKSLEEFISSIS